MTRLVPILILVVVGACAGRPPTDAEAPAMTTAEYSEFRAVEPLVHMALAGDAGVDKAIARQAQANVANGAASDTGTEGLRIAEMISRQVNSVARHRHVVACNSNGSSMIWLGPLGAIAAASVLLVEGAASNACMQAFPPAR